MEIADDRGSVSVPPRLDRPSRRLVKQNPYNVAILTNAPLGGEILAEWLRRITTSDRLAYFKDEHHLLGSDLSNIDLIVAGLCWAGRSNEQDLPVLRQICGKFRPIPVIAMISDPSPTYVRDLLGCGVKCIIPLTFSSTTALMAVRLVLTGGIYAPPEVPGMNEVGQGSDPAEWGAELNQLGALRLSPREAEVLNLLRTGCANLLIAKKLAISQHTVAVHVRHIMSKIGASNRTEAVFMANQIISGSSRVGDDRPRSG